MKIYFYISGVEKTFTEKFKINPPVIFDFFPKEVTEVNTEVTIVGESFSPVLENNIVYIGGYSSEIIEGSSSQIKIKVPEN